MKEIRVKFEELITNMSILEGKLHKIYKISKGDKASEPIVKINDLERGRKTWTCRERSKKDEFDNTN